MSLRIKLGAAFIVVLLGGWWRMNIVLDRQQTAFHLSREIEQFFSRVNSEEQLFIATGDLRHSRDVLVLFSDLRPRIERFQHFSTENGMLRHGTTVIDHFNAFQSGFTGFVSQVLDLQTFKSRVERESARLQDVADAVLNGGDERLIVIHREKDRILHAEKNYFLSGDAAAAAEVSSAVRSIADLARAVRQSAAESDAALEAFRIARIASMFEENLLTYIAKKQQLDKTASQRRVAREAFSRELLASIDRELVSADQRVSQLQLLMIISLAVAMLLCVAVTLLVSGVIISPVNQLKRSAREIVNGNLETSVAIESGDEIGELGEMFNTMTSRLREVFADNQRYRTHLEELVRERTETLERESPSAVRPNWPSRPVRPSCG